MEEMMTLQHHVLSGYHFPKLLIEVNNLANFFVPMHADHIRYSPPPPRLNFAIQTEISQVEKVCRASTSHLHGI